jgi:hypothetical protein
MNLHSLLVESDGKGLVGCMLSIVLLIIAGFLGITLGPVYYNNFNFEADIKSEVSRAGAHIYDNETVIKDIIALAKKDEIRIKKEDISLERFAGQVHIKVNYSVPVDLLFFERNLNFEVSVSSFIGSL